MYKAVFFASNGDYVTDFEEGTSQKVWDAISSNMNKWLFYPIACVCKGEKVVEVGWGIPEWWIGKSISAVEQEIKSVDESILNDVILHGNPLEMAFIDKP